MTHEELAFKLVKTKCFHDYTTGAHCAACATEAIRRHADLMLETANRTIEALQVERRLENEGAESLRADIEAARDLWKLARQRADSAELQVRDLNAALQLAYDWMGRKPMTAYAEAHLRHAREQAEGILKRGIENRVCDHAWSHIEDNHYFCPKCKSTKDVRSSGDVITAHDTEKRVEESPMQKACQHEICDCESCKRRNDTRCRKCEWRA